MFKSIDLLETDLLKAQQYLQAAVAPRPIALASTIDNEGNVNLSPFSFFNLFSTNPPVLVFAPNSRLRDGTNKHTFFNAMEIKEVVINMVDFSMAEQMSLSSCEYPAGINEFSKSGLTPLASDVVKPPRVLESKVSFECKVLNIIELGEGRGAGNMIICEVLRMHIREDILNQEGAIDMLKTDWIARCGGDWYVRANAENMFLLPKPNVKLGIGVDVISDKIKSLNFFNGNELGRLGNADTLPTKEEVEIFMEDHKEDLLLTARNFLSKGEVSNAWKALLAYERTIH